MVTAAGRKVLQKAIFSFWERIPRRKTGELQVFQKLIFPEKARDPVGAWKEIRQTPWSTIVWPC